jgi:DNA polymerase type B, organellar and viral
MKVPMWKSNPFWQTFRFEIGIYVDFNIALKNAFKEFMSKEIKRLEGKNTIFFMFKVQTDQGFRSITHLQRINISKTTYEKYMETYHVENISRDFQKFVAQEMQDNAKTLLDLITLCGETWYLVRDRYGEYNMNFIVFDYKIVPSDEIQKITQQKDLKNKLIPHKESIISKPELQIYSGHHLPTTMDFTQWGEYELSLDFKTAIVKKTNNKGKETKIEYHIKLDDYKLLVDLKVGSLTAFSWVDTLDLSNNEDIKNISKNLGSFKRTINKNTYYFEDGKLQLHFVSKSSRKITTVNKSTYRSKDFITYDIETKTIDGLMIPYCVCLYDGSNHKVFYITDYDYLNLTVKEKSDVMLKDSILFLLKPKYTGYKVYAHNFSYFDGIFLMKILTEMNGVVKPIIRDGKFIETKIFYDWKETTDNLIDKTVLINYENISNDNIYKEINTKAKNCKYNISFRDSLLLLPSKLSELAKTFGVENKDLFPYKFVNEKTTTFEYEGNMPSLQYYNVSDMGDDISERLQTWKEYQARFNNKNWNLKTETILYCKKDVKILWEILDNYSKIIFENWYVDLMKSPTISSLAFKLFRSNYLPDLDKQKITIPTITGKVYEDIKKSYTGGAVDVYKPYGENIKVYDVKSLYPSVMLNNPMPVGNPTYFEGNILVNKDFWINNEKPFGFFYVKVQAPKDMKEPILQVKRKINNLTRTIAPIGSWKGWYFSEELYNAEKYGYKFEVLKGYTFNKGYIFKDYVEKLYKIKESNPKGSPMNLNAKLLLNSLYGRFGMSPHSDEHIVLPSSLSNQFLLDDKFDILDVIDFKNNKELITYKVKHNPNIDDNIEENKYKNVSIVVASAITAYGRIHMSQFKNNPQIGELLYSDTDCIAITGELNEKHIGKGIGQMEVEKQFIKVVYLAPKVYIGLMQNKKDSNKIEVHAVIKGINVEKKAKQFKFNDFVSLLTKGQTFGMEQEKWSRNIADASVTIESVDYNLIVTENKREIIYNNNNTFVDTKPLIFQEE